MLYTLISLVQTLSRHLSHLWPLHMNWLIDRVISQRVNNRSGSLIQVTQTWWVSSLKCYLLIKTPAGCADIKRCVYLILCHMMFVNQWGLKKDLTNNQIYSSLKKTEATLNYKHIKLSLCAADVTFKVSREACDWTSRSMMSSYEERCSWTSTPGREAYRHTASGPERSEGWQTDIINYPKLIQNQYQDQC